MDIVCSVCMERLFGDDHIICNTVCSHVFHEQCFNNWLKKGKLIKRFSSNLDLNFIIFHDYRADKTCPECRAPSTEANLRRLFFNSEPRVDKHQDQIIKLRHEMADQKRT